MELEGIIGTAVGAIISFLGTLIHYKYTMKQVDKQLKLQQEEKKKEYLRELSKQKIQQHRIDREELISRLIIIKAKYNLTRNCIMEENNATMFDVNNKYLELVDDISKGMTKVYLSFPEYINDAKTISGICNNIWGNQNTFFYNQQEKGIMISELRTTLIGLFDQLHNECENLLQKLANKDDYISENN